MKKLLSLIGVASITTSGACGITANTLNQISNNQFKDTEESIDWNQVENYIDNEGFFESKGLYKNMLFDDYTYNELEKIIDSAKKSSLAYLNFFKDNNYDLEQITDYLKENISDFNDNFKADYSKIKKDIENNCYLLQDKQLKDKRLNPNLSKDEAINSTLATINKIKVIQASIYTAAVIAEIAAAGFWAAAFWGGISVPWAIAATALAGALFAINYYLKTFMLDYNDWMNKNFWEDVAWAADITLFAINTVNLIYNTGLWLYGTAASSTAWAVPAVFGTVGVFVVLYTWLKLYYDNILI